MTHNHNNFYYTTVCYPAMLFPVLILIAIAMLGILSLLKLVVKFFEKPHVNPFFASLTLCGWLLGQNCGRYCTLYLTLITPQVRLGP